MHPAFKIVEWESCSCTKITRIIQNIHWESFKLHHCLSSEFHIVKNLSTTKVSADNLVADSTVKACFLVAETLMTRDNIYSLPDKYRFLGTEKVKHKISIFKVNQYEDYEWEFKIG